MEIYIIRYIRKIYPYQMNILYIVEYLVLIANLIIHSIDI